MGFPSPATDFIERRVTLDGICAIGMNSRIVETSTGYAVIDISLMPSIGVTILFSLYGNTQFGFITKSAIITDDGEALEGTSLDDVQVVGVVTHTIHSMDSITNQRPVI
ncbi:hypothetical protein NLT11_001455 [Cronobacter sakazakii]|uniref:UmuD-like protein n=1 Tax=Cronobacter phage phiES15 TaxID=1168280 RepID=UPI00025F687B|nr:MULTISPECIES: hypothetical protein [Cronobacter]YP_006590057.1 UmuD-like protein [Cronobacter phage phiES15]AFH14974.1 hypothetical protein phiES15_052 [Cronobacter phage phiES15]AFJ98482.1 hypothetical protein ES15_0909 [Cronobacter sakazakii ES15]EGT4258602.1 hypothetical protein [Cronobacter sakazakii]EGT4269635.1 hypothetical protein [Cronobacter sakazakii]EGT4300529.1 hypothetical protein [Cronobacter sakazakii]